jgi:hypothetical protein
MPQHSTAAERIESDGRKLIFGVFVAIVHPGDRGVAQRAPRRHSGAREGERVMATKLIFGSLSRPASCCCSARSCSPAEPTVRSIAKAVTLSAVVSPPEKEQRQENHNRANHQNIIYPVLHVRR